MSQCVFLAVKVVVCCPFIAPRTQGEKEIGGGREEREMVKLREMGKLGP